MARVSWGCLNHPKNHPATASSGTSSCDAVLIDVKDARYLRVKICRINWYGNLLRFLTLALLSLNLRPSCLRRPRHFRSNSSGQSALSLGTPWTPGVTQGYRSLGTAIESGDGTMNCRQLSLQLRFFLFQCFNYVHETSSWD